MKWERETEMHENWYKIWYGNQFREIRKYFKLSQKQFADKLGYEVTSIRLVEQRRRLPSKNLITRIKNVYDRDLTPPKAHSIALPTWETKFVGRTDDLESLRKLFDKEGKRCVTLLGNGGVGKTRLAAKYGEMVTSDVFFIRLQSIIPSAEAFLSAIATAIELEPTGRAGTIDPIIKRLRKRPSLLILDNFDHFVESSADIISTLIEEVETVRILVTSRRLLKIEAETIYNLGGLSSEASIELFTSVVKRLWPQFDFEKEKAYVERICKWMKGLPLGIEVVAPLVRNFPGAKILASLQAGELEDDQLNRPWQTTWERLGVQEQARLKQLSIFEGGFTWEAAQSITAITPAQLMELCDHSWLQWSEERYNFHPLTLSFLQNVSSLALLNDTRLNHVDYYINLLARHGQTLRHDHPQEAKDHLLPETANLKKAYDHLVLQQDVDTLATFISNLFHLYKTTWELPMFVQLLQTAIGLSADSLLTAEWERILAEAYFRMGNVEQSLEHYHRTLDLLGAPYPMPERHTLLKPALHYLQHRFTPMFSVSQSATPSQNLTLALTYEKMGMIYYIKNDTARTLSSCLHGYNRARESKNGEAIAYTSVNLSFAWIALRFPNQAKHHIKQALNAIEPYNSRCLRTRINGRRTVYYNSIGDWGKGEKLSQFAINEFEKLELWREYGEQQTIFCMNLYLQGKYEQIIEQIEALKAVYQYDKSDQLLSGLLAQTYGYIRLEQWDQVEELVNELGQSFDSVRFTGTMEPIYHTVMSLWWTHQQAHEQALYHIQQVDELLQSRTHSFAMFPCFEGAIEACKQIRTDSTNPQISQEALELMEQLLRSLKTFCGTYQFAAEHYACYATETTSSNSASSATA